MPSPYNIALQERCTNCSIPRTGRFCDLSASTIESLDAMKFTSVYPKGSLLYVEGESARGVFILCSGKVKMTTSSSEGRTFIVRIAEAGEMLGANSAILNAPYEVTAETLEPCQIASVRRDDFLALLKRHPDACMRVAQQLSDTLLAAQREIRSLGLSQTTSEKVAKLILGWCEKGDPTANGIRLKVLLTHEEIAQMVGTTRETVTRVLSDFKRKKIINVKGSTVFVPTTRGLQDMVTV
ncbi:MAG TPA: Crp/Fnr family transcriptional regulator [Thermoanaerobaculia bacterium]